MSSTLLFVVINTIEFITLLHKLIEYYVISGSYEDSLKSLRQHTISGSNIRHTSLMRRGNDISTRRRQRHNSISGDVVHLAPDMQQQPVKQQHKPSVLIAAPNSALVRRASERSVICPLTNEWKHIRRFCGFDDFVIIEAGKFCFMYNFAFLYYKKVVFRSKVSDHFVKEDNCLESRWAMFC